MPDASIPPFDLPVSERAKLLDEVSRIIGQHPEDVRSLSVARPVSPDDIRSRLTAYDFNRPIPPSEVLEDVVQLLRHGGMTHVTHPAYFGLFNPASAFMAIVGDALAAAFNPQLAVWEHAPAAVEIEDRLIGFFGDLMGFDGETACGTFCTGGAEANLTALLVALAAAFPEVARHGVRALRGDPVFYASAESHLAWLKIARHAGLGEQALRLVPVTADLKMDVEALDAAIDADRAAGAEPFLVAATAGTTGTGIIDPLPELAALCSRRQLYFHVDAAWAGATVLSEHLRPVLAGIDRADSVTLDAHKWLSVPMGAGMFMGTRPDALRRAFAVATPYMPSHVEGARDPYTSSIQWSRRFAGLKLFMALATAGREGYASQIERDCRLGDLLRARLQAAGWEVVNRTPLPVVCFRDSGAGARRHGDSTRLDRIAARVVDSGRAWLSTTRVHGDVALRACITSFRTTPRDIDTLVEELDRARALDLRTHDA